MTTPPDADHTNLALIDRLIDVIEHAIIPKTAEGVAAGFSGRAGRILRVLGGVRRGGAARRCWR